MGKTAILVDGGFYRKKYEKGLPHTPSDAADALIRYCFRHLNEHHTHHDLYRIFITMPLLAVKRFITPC